MQFKTRITNKFIIKLTYYKIFNDKYYISLQAECDKTQ